MDLSKLNLPLDVRPEWTKAIPTCPADSRKCPLFDGKRCQATGFRARWICEPAVEAMATERDAFHRHDMDWRAAQAAVEWNAGYPTGQVVSYEDASGVHQAKTQAPAYLENGKTAVVPLEERGMQIGSSGVHLPVVMELDRVTPVETDSRLPTAQPRGGGREEGMR